MKKKLIFLDRDGVIIRFPGVGRYVTRWSQFRFVPKSRQAIALLTKAGYEVVVISNQGCLSRGLLSRAMLTRMTHSMKKQVEKMGGRLDQVRYCPHQSADRCECKKPKQALVRRALRRRRMDMRSVFFIGDSEEDMGAGKNAGCRTILVLSGRNKRSDVAALAVKPDVVKKNLWEAVHWILAKKS